MDPGIEQNGVSFVLASLTMGNYSIKDLEKLSRVKAHTIRIWEKRYGLLDPARSGTNIRSYSDSDLRKLLNIALLNDNGFKISHIATFDDEAIRAHVTELESSEKGAVDQVESLILAMTEMDEARFEKVMANSILRSGFEHTMLEVIQPFLQRVGVLWLIDAVKPGQEHFISSLLRQKVISAIDGLVPIVRERPKTILFFLPEGELHELGLLFAHYLARKHGHHAIYLGQSVPFEDLMAVVEYRKPSVMVTGFLSHQDVLGVNAYLRKLHEHFPAQQVLFFHGRLEGVKATKAQRMMPDMYALKAEFV